MKLLRSILFSMLMGIAVAAHAMDQDVQVDLLMAKITNALKQNRVADALPAFAQLESMEPTLQNPLSEGFHFLYIDTLDKSGNHAKALSRANIYMDKFGKQGKYYDKVIEIMSRLQDQVEEESRAKIKLCETKLINFCNAKKGARQYFDSNLRFNDHSPDYIDSEHRQEDKENQIQDEYNNMNCENIIHKMTVDDIREEKCWKSL